MPDVTSFTFADQPDHLQTCLLELRRGFCFEARQQRLTFDNEHLYVDLVFY